MSASIPSSQLNPTILFRQKKKSTRRIITGSNSVETKSEIDEIFSKCQGKEKRRVEEKPAIVSQKKMRKNKSEREDDMGFGTATSDKIVKKGNASYTADGLRIYTMEDLGLDKEEGGDTPLCPFDCECCI